MFLTYFGYAVFKSSLSNPIFWIRTIKFRHFVIGQSVGRVAYFLKGKGYTILSLYVENKISNKCDFSVIFHMTLFELSEQIITKRRIPINLDIKKVFLPSPHSHQNMFIFRSFLSWIRWQELKASSLNYSYQC